MINNFWFYFFLTPVVVGTIILSIPSFYYSSINPPVFEEAVSTCKNISNEEIRGAKKPLSDSAKFERSFFTEKEKKILDKYDINVVGVKPNKNMKEGGRLNDGAAFIKSLYKDKL